MIRIGETHAVAHQIKGPISRGLGQMDYDATEAVKRLESAGMTVLDGVNTYRADIDYAVVSGAALRELRAALAPFTDTDASLVDSGKEMRVGRVMKEFLFSLIGSVQKPVSQPAVHSTEYGGVLVDTPNGQKYAYLRLSFDDVPSTPLRSCATPETEETGT